MTRSLRTAEERNMDEPERVYSGVRCSACGYEFDYDELYGECDGRTVCVECAEREFSNLSPGEKLERLGYEPTRQVRWRG